MLNVISYMILIQKGDSFYYLYPKSSVCVQYCAISWCYCCTVSADRYGSLWPVRHRTRRKLAFSYPILPIHAWCFYVTSSLHILLHFYSSSASNSGFFVFSFFFSPIHPSRMLCRMSSLVFILPMPCNSFYTCMSPTSYTHNLLFPYWSHWSHTYRKSLRIVSGMPSQDYKMPADFYVILMCLYLSLSKARINYIVINTLMYRHHSLLLWLQSS